MTKVPEYKAEELNLYALLHDESLLTLIYICIDLHMRCTLTINSDGITCHHSTHTYNGHTDIIIIINT